MGNERCAEDGEETNLSKRPIPLSTSTAWTIWGAAVPFCWCFKVGLDLLSQELVLQGDAVSEIMSLGPSLECANEGRS